MALLNEFINKAKSSFRSFGNAQAFRSPRAPWLLLSAFFLLVAYIALSKKGYDWQALRSNLGWWDAGWYTQIVTKGYEPSHAFAFFPLWPAILKLTSYVFPFAHIPLIGCTISSLLLVALVKLIHKPYGQTLTDQTRFFQATNIVALIPLLFAPAGWVFATNHTESLFVLLGVAAFHYANKDSLVPAAVCAGLAALTKNQGVIIAFCIGLSFLLATRNNLAVGIKRFATSGMISAAIFALWPAYQFYQTGSPLASMEAQEHWGKAHSFEKYVSNMFSVGTREIDREIFFWLILAAGTYVLATHKKIERHIAIPVAIYLIGSVLLWPMQSHLFPNSYRYSLVLFPFWLSIGNYIARMSESTDFKKNVFAVVLIMLFLEKFEWRTGFYFTPGAWPY